MGRGQRGAQAAGDLHCLIGRQPTDATQQRCQVFAVNILHREERHAIPLADIVDPANVGVRYLAGDPNLGMKARQRGAIPGQGVGQELQCYRLLQLIVEGAIDFAHAATAGQAQNAITAGDQSAAVKDPFAVLRGRGNRMRRRRNGRGQRPGFQRIPAG